VEYGGALEIALHGVAAVKLNQIVLPAHEVQACALYCLQRNGPDSKIFDNGAAGDHVQMGKNSVQQSDGQIAADVLQLDFQGLHAVMPSSYCAVILSIRSAVPPVIANAAVGAFWRAVPALRRVFPNRGTAVRIFLIHRRQPRQAVFSRQDGVPLVAQVAAAGAVRVLYGQAGGAVVPGSLDGKFLGKGVQGVGAVFAGVVGGSGKTAVVKGQEIIRRAAYGGAVVEMQQAAVAVCLHLVGGTVCLQGKDSRCLVKLNRHMVYVLRCKIFGRLRV